MNGVNPITGGRWEDLFLAGGGGFRPPVLSREPKVVERWGRRRWKGIIEALQKQTRDTFNSRNGFITWSTTAPKLAVTWKKYTWPCGKNFRRFTLYALLIVSSVVPLYTVTKVYYNRKLCVFKNIYICANLYKLVFCYPSFTPTCHGWST